MTGMYWVGPLVVSVVVGGGLIGAGLALGWWLRGLRDEVEVEREIATWAPSTDVDLGYAVRRAAGSFARRADSILDRAIQREESELRLTRRETRGRIRHVRVLPGGREA